MRFSALATATLAGLALAMPQASSSDSLAPKDGPPPSCQTSFDGNFGLTIVELGKQSLNKRSSCNAAGSLDLTLKDSVLTDSQGRIGSIVANFQFQFDGPPQAGVIYTSGFSVCTNGSLALGGSTTFYRCLSGNFWNLYDRDWAEQCSPIHLSVLPCAEDAPVPSGGQVVGTTMVATTLVTVLEDGQPQVVATTVPLPICQIGDGQIQGHTTLCGELPPATLTATQPAYTPPGTRAPPATTVPPAQTTPQVSTPRVSTPPSNSTAPVNPPGTAPTSSAPTSPAGTTTPVAPPVSAGQSLAPASFLALVAMLFAVLYI
ncbi:cell wall mannoprotein CIS3 [Colletotrichum liriopes]|uniref:Cell wall mannoprotein CIS3 n=1 Tax=Colletotrichum liriopes TaxID=708192 RepID=A0AA37GGA2_9PEZI|nr:cell wall mannoprotein CIS3 [Colletotrichum liriopes]